MKSVRNFAQMLSRYTLWAVLAPLLMLLEVSMDLVQPWIIERIIDDGVAKQDTAFILYAGLGLLLAALVGIAGGIGCSFYAVKAAQGFGADVRAALFRQVQCLSFGNLDNLGAGPMVTRLTSDVTQVQEAVLVLLRILVRAPLMMAGSLAMAIVTAPCLAWLPLVLMALVLAGVLLIVRRTYPLYSLVQAQIDALNTVMQENLAGVRVIKAFVRAAREIQRFGLVNTRVMEQSLRVARVAVVTMPMMMIVMNLGVVAVLWFGGLHVNQGDMQVGQIVAFINYLQRALMSLLMVSMMILQISRAAASADRIAEVLDSRPAVPDRPAARRFFALRGQVEFEAVSFSYGGQDGDPVLKDISFVAEAGKTVALLGATGSGKSSLVQLIPRFYDVTSGRVLIDGMDVRELDQTVLRRQIGLAMQETVLFSGTIRDNIRFGRPDATDDEVVVAAKAAQAHDFIACLPGGYNTLLGQRGVNLSGGQKQRLAIARALLVRPAILILDDSTSAVDVETEARIQAALEAARRDRTCFIVAQRISTVLAADSILVLDDGRIVAEGTHARLLGSSSIYRDIYESQLGQGVAAYD